MFGGNVSHHGYSVTMPTISRGKCFEDNQGKYLSINSGKSFLKFIPVIDFVESAAFTMYPRHTLPRIGVTD